MCLNVFNFSYLAIVAEIGISEKIAGIWVGFRVTGTLAFWQA
jgi:hypothetical protein